MRREQPQEAGAGLIDQLNARQRWILFGALVIVIALALSILDLFTAAIQRRAVNSELDRLWNSADQKPLQQIRIVKEASGMQAAVSSRLEKPAGIDLVLLDLELTCGQVVLAATASNGAPLVSSRDYRLIKITAPGRYRVVLTVLGPTVPVSGYRVLLQSVPGCTPLAKLAHICSPSRRAWSGPPLMAAFAWSTSGWSAVLGTGPEWVDRSPDTAWLEGALKDEG